MHLIFHDWPTMTLKMTFIFINIKIVMFRICFNKLFYNSYILIRLKSRNNQSNQSDFCFQNSAAKRSDLCSIQLFISLYPFFGKNFNNRNLVNHIAKFSAIKYIIISWLEITWLKQYIEILYFWKVKGLVEKKKQKCLYVKV